VLGFGDYPFAQMLLPSLTSIRPPSREIGEVAALCVLEALGVVQAQGGVDRLQCRLIERESA
jgi:LacI family gluconate utilization system Gnt-I transcriptional repressor